MRVFSWRGTSVGAVLIELIPELIVLAVGLSLMKVMSSLHLPWHASIIAALAFGSVFVSLVVRMSRSLQAAATQPRLHSLRVRVPADSSWEVLQVAEHAEIALGLARDFHKRGQKTLARQMVDGVIELVDSVLTMDVGRKRIAQLPGASNEAAVERCVDAMKTVDEALMKFSVDLAEAGGVEEWNAARVSQALGRAANAQAVANALNEVARCA